MKLIKIIVENMLAGMWLMKGVVVGEGDTYDEALSDVKSSLQFHVETFGLAIFDTDTCVLEAFIAKRVSLS